MLLSIHQKGVHLSENELRSEEVACPICGYTGNRPPLIVLQRDPPVHLLACRCGCMSASRMPHPEVLSDYYSRYYAATNGTATFDGSDRFARHLFRVLGGAPKNDLRILDFGGGVDATISRSLARQFTGMGTRHVEIALVDYNASCQKDWGAVTVDCYRSLREAGDGFDLVIASAIVEHIPYPRDTILGLLNSLGEQGRAYFRTPNVASVIKLAGCFGVHIGFTYPGHLHDMGQAFWENLPASLGRDRDFSLIRSRPSIAETEFRAHPSRTAISLAIKLPWLLLRNRYTMVGGWEAVIARTGHS
jgi:2-polyprenyl-3-methyl-5-hydroxy-6-metoxy-1,4-benzoquinol methylase